MTLVSAFVASGRAESMLIKNTLAKDPTGRDPKSGERRVTEEGEAEIETACSHRCTP